MHKEKIKQKYSQVKDVHGFTMLGKECQCCHWISGGWESYGVIIYEHYVKGN